MSDYTSWQTGKTVEDYNSGGDFVLPEEDTYTLKLVDKDPDEPVAAEFNKTGKPKFRAKFKFEIVDDDDFGGTVINQFYTISLNEKSNLLPVVRALVGRDLEPTDRIGWEDGVWTDDAGNEFSVVGIGGKKMKATIKHEKKEDGRIFPKIVGPIALRARGGKKAAEPVEPEESEDVPF